MSNKKIVENYLIEKGFIIASGVSDTENGFDIVAIKNNKYFIIEVKNVVIGVKSCHVNKLEKSGLQSDYIAIITPKKNIIFDTIKDHIKLCAKCGTRSLTKLVRLCDA